jgi:hypothetical protein
MQGAIIPIWPFLVPEVHHRGGLGPGNLQEIIEYSGSLTALP